VNELQKIIEGFKKAGERAEELMEGEERPIVVLTLASIAAAYKTVIKELEDFMSTHSVFCINVDEVSAKVAEGYRALIKDLEEERSN